MRPPPRTARSAHGSPDSRVLLPPVCILAGGLGTRLGEFVQDTPKPLLEVAGAPFAIHQLRLLAEHGARHVVMCVGYLGEQIVARLGEEQFGIEITYSFDPPRLLGTLGAIRNALPRLGDRFLVLHGDTYLRIDYRAAAEAWVASEKPGLMTVLRNQGQWDVSNVEFDGERIVSYDKRAPTRAMEWIDYGLGGLTVAALERVAPDVSDLADLLHVLARDRDLFGYAASERFYDIGTPQALAETGRFLSGQ